MFPRVLGLLKFISGKDNIEDRLQVMKPFVKDGLTFEKS